MNAIVAVHNVEKQMTDSRGEVAYLMADISDVKEAEIKDLFQSLEELPCKSRSEATCGSSNRANSTYPDEGAVLSLVTADGESCGDLLLFSTKSNE